MENDIENHLTTNINEIKTDNLFRLDYKGQSLKDNLKFNSWKNRMLQKYGNDAKLFKCSYDSIYFYCSNESFRKLPLCSSICPSCNHSICYYCSRIAYNRNSFGDCCLKRRIYYKFIYDGFLFINIEDKENLKEAFLFFLCPIFSFFLLVGSTCSDFFYLLRKHKSNDNQDLYYKDEDIFRISILINGLMAIILSISYIIYSFYFKLFLLVISIFTKFYPIKYYLGILKGGLDHLD